MKISLVVGTVGERQGGIVRLLSSVAQQSHRNVEVVFVLQGPNEIAGVIESFRSSVDLSIVTTDEYGLSRARNIGVRHSSGEVIAFPDDDCFYEPRALDNALEHMKRGEADVVVGSIVDPKSGQPFLRYPRGQVSMKPRHLWLAPSISIVMTREVFEAVSGFDERFGLGGQYKTGNETDLLFRIRENSPEWRFLFDPAVRIFHPKLKRDRDFFVEHLERALEVSRGRGALVRKHLGCAPGFWSRKFGEFLCRKLIAMAWYGILRFDMAGTRYYGQSFRALLAGFAAYESVKVAAGRDAPSRATRP